jgi:glucose-6-phosphate 1-epimerase
LKLFLSNIEGLKYIDKVQGGKLVDETADELVLTGETDRVYLDAPTDIKITCGSKTILLHKQGFSDCVVWNLRQAKCKEMADMGADDWKTMICAESGAIGKPVTVKAGTTWTGFQEISKL